MYKLVVKRVRVHLCDDLFYECPEAEGVVVATGKDIKSLVRDFESFTEKKSGSVGIQGDNSFYVDTPDLTIYVSLELNDSRRELGNEEVEALQNEIIGDT